MTTDEGDPSRYRQIPDNFGRFDFGRAPAGEPDCNPVVGHNGDIELF
jgi:hypothetical protein